MGAPVIFNGTAAKFLTSSIKIPGSTSGALTLLPAAATTSYSFTFPAAVAAASSALTSDTSGVGSWLGYTSTVSNSNLVSRDSNGNSGFNNTGVTVTSTATNNQTITMTAGSTGRQRITTGTGNITFNLPDASTVLSGWSFYFNNTSSGTVTVNRQDGVTLVATMAPGSIFFVACMDNSTVQGVWAATPWLTPTATSNTAGTSVPGIMSATSFTGAGTGLTGTAASLTAGTVTTNANLTGDVTSSGNATSYSVTVPVNKGGTGQTSYTDGQLLIGNTSGNTLTKATLTAGTNVTITNGNGSISIASTASGATGVYWSGYFSNGKTWTRSNAAFGDPVISSGSSTLNNRASAGLSVSAGAGNIPGITFTPGSATAVYKITASFVMYTNVSAIVMQCRLFDGTTELTTCSAPSGSSATNVDGSSVTLSAIYAPASASPQTVKIQLAGSGGSLNVIGSATPAQAIEWTVVQIAN